MIDLHCHLLPEVDDGPRTLEESIAMARAAYQDGVRTVVVTPHALDWEQAHPGQDARQVLDEQVRSLEQALHQADIPLSLVAGMEVHFDLDLEARLKDGRARPLGQGPYVLVELPFLQYSLYLERVVFQLQLQGWKPVLAHAERYVYFQENPDLLAPLVERGVLVQVTVDCLLGETGPAARETAQRLLRRGLAHCLASDGHTAGGPRPPLLSTGVQAAARIIGLQRARAMVTDVPEHILAGKPLDAPLEAALLRP